MKIEGDGLDGKRILVVEDERLIALYNQDLLEDWGCSVVGPAGSVSSALELLEADVPHALRSSSASTGLRRMWTPEVYAPRCCGS